MMMMKFLGALIAVLGIMSAVSLTVSDVASANLIDSSATLYPVDATGGDLALVSGPVPELPVGTQEMRISSVEDSESYSVSYGYV